MHFDPFVLLDEFSIRPTAAFQILPTEVLKPLHTCLREVFTTATMRGNLIAATGACLRLSVFQQLSNLERIAKHH